MNRAETRIKVLAAATIALGGIGTARAVTFEDRSITNISESAIAQPNIPAKYESRTVTTVFSPSTSSKNKNGSPATPESKSIPPVATPTTKKAEAIPQTTRPAATATTKPTCENIETPNWSRQELVRRLDKMDAFSAPYQTNPPSDPRGDLLNPSRSTGALVRTLSGVTAFMECEGIEGNLRSISSGHHPDSLHARGDAADLTPKNGKRSLPAWKITNDDPPIPPTPEQIISNPMNHAANESAHKIVNFLEKQPGVWDVIWMGSRSVMNNGKKILTPASRYWKGQRVRISHDDHIHWSVNP